MRIGLLGGTFDPVHKGHLKLAKESRRQFHLSRVYMVLSPRSPFKIKAPLSSVPDRLRMLTLALRGQSSLKPGTWELKETGPSYTVRTLEKLKKLRPHDEFFLIMGSDAWQGFARWKNPNKILRLATLLVGRRPGAGAVKISPKYKDQVRALKGVFPDVSSSSIRSHRGWESAQKMVPPAVRRYIRQHGLYGKAG
jgi:nicotinate-nucleotide adenylyltransferase